MCPMCMATAGIVLASSATAGGLVTAIVAKTRKRKAENPKKRKAP